MQNGCLINEFRGLLYGDLSIASGAPTISDNLVPHVYLHRNWFKRSIIYIRTLNYNLLFPQDFLRTWKGTKTPDSITTKSEKQEWTDKLYLRIIRL